MSVGSRSDLFPSATWHASRDAAPAAPPGRASPAAVATSQEALGKLDIPLIFRKGGATAKAVAKLVLRPSSWRFAYVDGDPVLRAVLFESLRDPANASIVRKLFDDLGSREVMISLRQRTVVTNAGEDRYDERVSVEGAKIVIERIRYAGVGEAEVQTPADLLAKGSAQLLSFQIPLPDAEADRAVLRDRIHRERLADSPAFHAPIRDRDP